MNEYIESCHREKRTYDEEGVREAVRLFLKSIGEDPEREGLVETPDRIKQAYILIRYLHYCFQNTLVTNSANKILRM